MKGKKLPQQRLSCVRVLYAMLVPFLLTLLVGMTFDRQRLAQHHGPSSGQRGALEAGQEGPCTTEDCSTVLPGGRSDQPLTNSGLLLRGGVGSVGSRNLEQGVLQEGSGGTGADGHLPPLFLFIGVLSGRGYRHRRLAVREAWSDRAQRPGEVVTRFILSEDERTVQVEKEMEQYGDIVFVHEKTNYKSILFKTFYVSRKCGEWAAVPARWRARRAAVPCPCLPQRVWIGALPLPLAHELVPCPEPKPMDLRACLSMLPYR
jgi:hypothetical protein